MADAWKLLLLTLALAGVYCARRTQPWLRYEDIITEALRVYNDAQRGRPLFRLVEATLPFRLVSVWGSGSEPGSGEAGATSPAPVGDGQERAWHCDW